MSNNNKTPAIRFKGFTDTWEQRGFSSVFEILQNNTLSRADLCDESGLAQNIHYGDVLIKYGEVLDVGNEPLAYINSDKIVTAMKNSYLQNGDVIIADTAEDATVGKCSEIANLGDKTVLSGLHTIPVRPKEEYASGYLGYYLNSNSYHDTLIPLMQGTKVTSISKSALQGTSISYPKSLDEQAEISAYFQNLDNLITLHQRKCDKLIQFKAAMLKKMFPQNGADKPELRFKGFTDAWEQREFGDENDLITGYPFESDCFSETGINLIRGMNVKRGYIDLSNDICVKWTSSKGLESYLLKENDIIIQMDGALIGKSYGIIKKKHLPALLVQRVTRARINNEIADSDFMYQTIQRDFLTYISMNKTETAVPHLSLNDIKNFGIMVPTLLEQKMIGSFFANLDRLITLHQRKCDKYKSIKAGLIRKFFP